ncbi:MAG: hypothetical protein ACFCD0_02490 [Gemmataceae bacterium]
MESWRKVWRDGFGPFLPTTGLKALREALKCDDEQLIQGATTSPPPLQCVQDWPVESCCVIGFCFWQGEGLQTVAEIEEAFARTCFEADNALGEPAACRWFLNWYDETPREEMREEMLGEVELLLHERIGGFAEPKDEATAA